MTERPSYSGLELALQVVAFEWSVRSEEDRPLDPIAALESLRQRTDAFPAEMLPLRDVYPSLVRLAAASLAALAVMPHPDEVDGLWGYEGFELWQQSRRPDR
jgi:hypothetical protein